MTEAMTPQWIAAFVSVGWLALALLVFFAVLPIVLRLRRERTFTVSVAGFQVSVQNATEQIADQLRDLQDRVRMLEMQNGVERPDAAVDTETSVGRADQAGSRRQTPPKRRARRILWVDDFPSNNAFAVDKLRKDGFEVVLCESTASGFRTFRDQEFGLVLSDMGRKEKDGNNPTAGLDLLRLIRQIDPDMPVVFFASRRAVEQCRAEALSLGAIDVTSSAVELFEHIDRAFVHG